MQKKRSPLAGKTVLIADDEADLRVVLGIELKNRGAKVMEAWNGLDVLDTVRKHKIDIVVSDVRMPIYSGIEMLQELMKSKDRPIVLLTTGHDDVSETSAQALGAFALLKKPYDRERMVGLLERAADSLER